MNARTLSSADQALNDVRTLLNQVDEAAKHVRTLLPRTGQFVVPTTTLAANIGAMLVREQFDHNVEQTVEWSMAMFNVSTLSGGVPARDASSIAAEIYDAVEERFGADDITLTPVIEIVHAVLTRVYGKQLRVTGWLPGFRIAEGRKVIELSGDACPSCTTNPTGFEVGNRYGDRATAAKSRIARCLNSEDCGWTNA